MANSVILLDCIDFLYADHVFMFSIREEGIVFGLRQPSQTYNFLNTLITSNVETFSGRHVSRVQALVLLLI